MSEKIRIAKRMANAGLCSRREAERWIADGRVSINGTIITTPATTVAPADNVCVDGNPLPQQESPRLWCYHKPRGLITTHQDPQGRPTIFEKLPDSLPRVISVGRLDINSEGLLLLTNHGELSRYMELPTTGWIRHYRLRVFGKPTRLDSLTKGITVDGVHYGPITATLEQSGTSNSWISVSLSEGKNRELRRIFEHLGHPVSRLIRTSYGPFQLGRLKQGEIKEVSTKMLRQSVPLHFFPKRKNASGKRINSGISETK